MSERGIREIPGAPQQVGYFYFVISLCFKEKLQVLELVWKELVAEDTLGAVTKSDHQSGFWKATE